MASIELVTSHEGTPHITTEQVKDLLAGFSGDISGIKVFKGLDQELATEIKDLLDVEIKTGQGLAGGYHFQLTDAYDWTLDDEAVGYSRIDVLYLTIFEDPLTNVQSADFSYQKGAPYPNGTSGTAPSAPTGTDIKESFAFLRADITDGAVVMLTSYATTYLSNREMLDAVETAVESVGGTVAQVEANTNALNGLRFGRDGSGSYGYYKVGADTVTPFRAPTGNAVSADVLSGKTFANANSDSLAGTMADRGAWNGTGTPTGNNEVTVTIPQGYHNGSGKVTCKGQSSYSAGYSAGNTDGIAMGHADTKNLPIGSVTLNYNGGSGTITVTVGGGSKTYNIGGMGFGTETITAKVGYNNGVTNGAII